MEYIFRHHYKKFEWIACAQFSKADANILKKGVKV